MNDVNGVAFSPRGDTLATASEDHTLGIWDPATGERLMTLYGHSDMVNCVAYSPDASLLASGGVNGELKLWDARTGTELSTIQAHATNGADWRIHAVTFAPDGTRLATGGADQVVKIWTVPSLELVFTFENPEPDLQQSLQKLRFRPGTETLVAAFRSGHLRCFDLRTRERVDEHLTNQYILNLAFSPDGRTLATAGDAGYLLRLWNADCLELEAAYGMSQEASWCVDISPDGQYLAAGVGHDTALMKFEPRPVSREIAYFDVPIDCLAVAPDSQTVVVGCPDGTLRQLELASGTEFHRQVAHTGGVTCARYSPTGTLLATGGQDRVVRVWDATSHRELRSLAGFPNSVLDVAFSHDGRQLAACDGTVVLFWDATTGEKSDEWPAPSVKRIALGSSGGLLMAGDQLWYRMPDRQPLDIHEAESEVLTIDSARDRTFVAMAPEGLRPALFAFALADAHKPERVTYLSPHRSNRILAVAVSKDGKTLAAADSRGWTAFWNLPTGAKMFTVSMARLSGLPDHFEKIGLQFTPDDSSLVFALTPDRSESTTEKTSSLFALHAPRRTQYQRFDPADASPASESNTTTPR